MVVVALSVGLVVERWAASSEWGSVTWRPVTVFAVAPEVEAWTPLGGTAVRQSFYAGVQTVELYSTETANYLDNLGTGTPLLWVVLRPRGDDPPCEIVTVTADPSEGEAFTEPGSDVVETVAMPPEIAAAIAEFVAVHHVERVFEKRKRDKTASKAYGPGGLGQPGLPPAKK
jgi:hypothetical protein